MKNIFSASKTNKSVPITLLTTKELKSWLKNQKKRVQTQVKTTKYAAKPGSTLFVTAENGSFERVLHGVPGKFNHYILADLAPKLSGFTVESYYIANNLGKDDAAKACFSWALGTYKFTTYKNNKADKPPKLVWPAKTDKKAVTAAIEGHFLTRDLINTPANDMGPAELAAAARKLANKYKATCTITTGNALLKKNYPAVYEVGKGSPRAPRLIDMKWGNSKHPKVTLVGKGVCFDTGGLDIKPSSGMILMKKDMGGAAHVLGLAQMIMAAKLKVRLRVLIPAVENSVDGSAFRPSDVIKTRKGISVEVGNTDAEGRLVLSDALTEAAREKPALIMDFATLTGAARVALGPDLPPMFCNDEKTADALIKAAEQTDDPLWRMPLWQPYAESLGSSVADTNNISAGGFGGAITAALFLEKFVEPDTPWVHLDVYGWTPKPKPGRPVGGEAFCLRASYEMIAKKFG